MPALKYLKNALLASAMLSLTACVVAPDSPTHQAPSQNPDNDFTPPFISAFEKADQEHLYLEEVLGAEALTEVKNWNARSLNRLMSDPLFTQLNKQALDIVNSKDKIPYVSYRNGEVHNFWQDQQHERGLWRKSTLASYLSDSPVWETVLDIITSTKDDRVHPAHARKMAKRMEDQDHRFLYYENIDGGHSAAANLKETAKRIALQYTYLTQQLTGD